MRIYSDDGPWNLEGTTGLGQTEHLDKASCQKISLSKISNASTAKDIADRREAQQYK